MIWYDRNRFVILNSHSMQRSIFVPILIIGGVVLVGGIALLQSSPSEILQETLPQEVVSQDTQESTLPSAVEVVYTGDAFVPSVFAVPLGGTVRFVNKSQRMMWPASDVHPTHTVYPELDPRSPIGIGGEWSFRFEKQGVWRMHDHLNPRVSGIISVE